jgi:hypothetical protein
MVISWARALTPQGNAFRMPMSFGSVGFDDHPVADFYRGVSQNHYALNVGLAHALSALRIMQQPYAARANEHAPRAAAKRLARQDASTDITVITFRQPPIGHVSSVLSLIPRTRVGPQWLLGCNVREVSEWAGHNSVAFTLTRYGGPFVTG